MREPPALSQELPRWRQCRTSRSLRGAVRIGDRLFFEDHSADIVQDDTFARLLTFPNVIVTGHQAFFTDKALKDIARTTFDNITQFERGAPLVNRVS